MTQSAKNRLELSDVITEKNNDKPLSIADKYRELNEKCDIVLDKISKRKNKKKSNN